MILILLGAVALTLMIFEKRFIFHPTRDHETTPSALGIPYEDLRIVARHGAELHAWFLPRPSARGTLLFFHGNAGNISHRVEKAGLLRRLGLQVLLLDYRGYGHSTGRPSEEGTYRDARAAWSALRSRSDVDPSRIVCFGESLGGAVAIDLATEEPCRALIIESSFTSMRDVAADIVHFTPLARLIATRYDSLSKLPRVHAPVLFLHGTRDDLVPFHHSERLFAAANPPKELFAIEGAGHNDPFVVARRAWMERIDRFLGSLPSFAGAHPRSETGS
jgi:fermentation-respiration switch protein FrsA (DUF1100 family)